MDEGALTQDEAVNDVQQSCATSRRAETYDPKAPRTISDLAQLLASGDTLRAS